MPAFLYYRPRQINPVTLADVKAWGLGYAFSIDPAQGLCQGHTPDENNGAIFHDHTRAGDSPLAMDVDNQTWAACAATGCWVGYWNNQKPTPADLARPKQLPGYDANLAGERTWKIPLVRRFNQETRLTENSLPSIMQCGPDGKWTRGRVIATHAHLWEVTQPFADEVANYFLNGAEQKDYSEQQIYEAATALLQANYAVGAGELSLLEAFADDNGPLAAIWAACDLPNFLRWAEAQKKTLDRSAIPGPTTSVGAAV